MDELIEQKIQDVYGLDHAQCKAELMRIERPQLDFTHEYLDALSVERLRHILVAAYLQSAKALR